MNQFELLQPLDRLPLPKGPRVYDKEVIIKATKVVLEHRASFLSAQQNLQRAIIRECGLRNKTLPPMPVITRWGTFLVFLNSLHHFQLEVREYIRALPRESSRARAVPVSDELDSQMQLNSQQRQMQHLLLSGQL